MGQATDVVDTFYSEAGMVDLLDTTVFPKVHKYSELASFFGF
jgi:hypothetical protein